MMLQTEDVNSYPRPPALQPVGHTLRVVLGGQQIVCTDKALRVLETHHAPTYYIPVEDILAQRDIVPGRSFCEWKGKARYWTLTAGGVTANRCGWDYPQPTSRFAALAGHMAIYAHAMDACFVGDQQVTPQPGDFYGGWVTPNLTGVVKGAPGTEGW